MRLAAKGRPGDGAAGGEIEGVAGEVGEAGGPRIGERAADGVGTEIGPGEVGEAPGGVGIGRDGAGELDGGDCVGGQVQKRAGEIYDGVADGLGVARGAAETEKAGAAGEFEAGEADGLGGVGAIDGDDDAAVRGGGAAADVGRDLGGIARSGVDGDEDKDDDYEAM